MQRVPLPTITSKEEEIVLVKFIKELVYSFSMTFNKWDILLESEDPKEFRKLESKLHILGKKKREEMSRKDMAKDNPIMRKENAVLLEKSASYCVIVILYDKRNHKGALLHIENPSLAQGALASMISKMYVTGSNEIMAVMIGGSRDGGSLWERKADNNWEASEKVLRDNHVNILQDMCLRDVSVKTIALWVEDGMVRGVISSPGSTVFDVFCEFKLSKF
jgi:chemotaxis receptor (MCP) glutamine deamidase CheD|tara:strand:+ start:2158 stop:2817 length:660 start_codon:yes stop_codon:yes gene_type:complete